MLFRSPFAVGYEAMRMGSVMYFVPFFFVLNPALILHGPVDEIIIVTVTAFIGILFIGAAIQGYLVGVGPAENTPRGILARILLFISGLLFAVPGGTGVGLSHIELALMAIAAGVPAILLLRQRRATATFADSPPIA